MIKPFYECNRSILCAAGTVLNNADNVHLLEYSNPFGTKRQVKAALKWLHHFGISATKETVLLTAGAQNALSVVLISLFKAGDKIAVDAFTYTNFKGLANFLHIQLISIEADEFGMSPYALLQICRNTEIKGIYLMPTCSNPTSTFMPVSRRQEIADIACQFHLQLIEDDIYSFLAPNEVKSFFSIFPEQTVHICRISKSLCARLRVAFLVFPEKYREALVTGMLNINLKTVSLNGEIVAELIESGTAFHIVHQKKHSHKKGTIFSNPFLMYLNMIM